MTDTYRTAVNPYTAKAAEARAKLERAAAAEGERKRAEMLREISEAIAPLYVYLHEGVCDDVTLLEDLPRRVGSAHFAKSLEEIETDVKKRAARRALVCRAVEPVSLAIVGTVLVSTLHYVLDGDFDWGRVVFVLACSLAFNLWYLDTFKRSPP